MESTKVFAEVWKEAHRERSEFVWSIIARHGDTAAAGATDPGR